MKKFYTCECVSEGHPDKVCDQIADAILDECLKQDPLSRCAAEIAIKTPEVYVFGELTTKANVNYEQIVKDSLKAIGYSSDKDGFNPDKCRIIVNMTKQSKDIKQSVDETKQKELGAGDQGMMYGYATKEMPNFMPFPFDLSRKLISQLRKARITKKLPYLRPDGKSQVTACYEDGDVSYIDNVVLSAHHDESVTLNQLKQDVLNHVIKPVLTESKVKYNKDMIFINPSGRFVIGGPLADSGLTGRKNIVDTYGGISRHGGGSYSGKDPTKVDRSGSYYARYVAKHIVAAGFAKRCEVAVAYVIGYPKPSMVEIETYGTATLPEQQIKEIINSVFDFSPKNIIEELGLRAPIYKQTARDGHFGIDGFPWEKLNKLNLLKSKAAKKAVGAVK
ncbi:MAG: methionine adenosyltransferase [Planctomycetes bacterium]|nr:methionine adenosyltransferase [Planctomycetota bacterium]